MTSKKCSKGKIRRSPYVRKTRSGKLVYVKSSCIKATGAYGDKSGKRTSAIIHSMLKRQDLARKKTSGTVECPKGYILRAPYLRSSSHRKSYIRKSGSQVKSSNVKGAIVPAKCIKSRGHDEKVGLYDSKGQRVYVILEKGSLGKHGYHNVANLSSSQRQSALDKAIAELNGNWLSVFRKINYLAVLNKYNQAMHKLYIEDRDYIKRKYAGK
jgi:hypothetical protein